MLCMNELRQVLGLEQNVLLGLANAIEQAGGNPIFGLQKIGDIRNPDLLLKLGGIIADAGNLNVVTVPVNRRIKLSAAIRQCGFDGVDSRIYCVPEPRFEPNAFLEDTPIDNLCFGSHIAAGSFVEIIKKVEAQGRRCIDIYELLALEAMKKSVARGATFALGTTWKLAKGMKGTFAAYVDAEVTEKGKLKKSLMVVEVSEINERICHIAKRREKFGSNLSWLPVVRKHRLV